MNHDTARQSFINTTVDTTKVTATLERLDDDNNNDDDDDER
jgi:hypothetical protein